MRYSYGIKEGYDPKRGRTISIPQLASIIKRDVEYGKWNNYHGGVEGKSAANCSYSTGNFTYHEKLYVYGTEKEFQQLEKLIREFIEVTPRVFTDN